MERASRHLYLSEAKRRVLFLGLNKMYSKLISQSRYRCLIIVQKVFSDRGRKEVFYVIIFILSVIISIQDLKED